MPISTAAETDSELSDDEKTEALQAVSRIATAATTPNPDDKTKGMVKGRVCEVLRRSVSR